MQSTVFMGHAPASRALRTMDVRKMCVRTLALARRASLPTAILATLATYAGVLVGSDPLTCSAAFVALSAVGIANSAPKGGES